jgi:hypothetical protein
MIRNLAECIALTRTVQPTLFGTAMWQLLELA